MIKKIGVLTSGGDSPGMNAAIRAVVRAGLAAGLEVYGIRDGYLGLHQDRISKLERHSVSDMINRGGTFLGSARFPAFKEESVRREAIENLKKIKPAPLGLAAEAARIEAVLRRSQGMGKRHLQVGDLCRVGATCERTLENAFKEVLGITPVAYLIRLRLHRVRQAAPLVGLEDVEGRSHQPTSLLIRAIRSSSRGGLTT